MPDAGEGEDIDAGTVYACDSRREQSQNIKTSGAEVGEQTNKNTNLYRIDRGRAPKPRSHGPLSSAHHRQPGYYCQHRCLLTSQPWLPEQGPVLAAMVTRTRSRSGNHGCQNKVTFWQPWLPDQGPVLAAMVARTRSRSGSHGCQNKVPFWQPWLQRHSRPTRHAPAP